MRTPVFAVSLLAVVGAAHAAVIPPEGVQALYLSTGPEDYGLGPSGIDLDGDGFDESDVAYAAFDFSTVGTTTLSFFFNVLTSEVTEGVADVFAAVLDGSIILSGEIFYDDGPFPEVTTFDGQPLFGPDGSFFSDGQTGFGFFSLPFVAAGNHRLEFFVGDEEDEVVDTALLIDAIALNGVVQFGFEGVPPGPFPPGPDFDGTVGVVSGSDFTSPIPEPSTVLLFGTALLGFAWRRKR